MFSLEEPESEHDVNMYIFIFAALAVVIFFSLRSVLGQRTGSERPFRISAFAYRLSLIASVLCAVQWVAYKTKWHAALEAAITPVATISGPARVMTATPSLWVYYWRWRSTRGRR